MNRLTLEQRISRLEKFLKNEKRTVKYESFESDADEDGARAAADRMAKEFSSMTGIRLRPDRGHDTVDSPLYGWSHNRVEDLANDPDARYTFVYDVVGAGDISVMFRPSDQTAVVWASEDDCEGAVDPNTGLCEWADWIEDVSYPLSAWRNFSLDMINSGEEYESLKRHRRLESRKYRKSRKFESADELKFTAAEARDFVRTLNNRNDIEVVNCIADKDTDSFYIAIVDEDGRNETTFDIYKYSDHVEAWRDGRSRFSESFKDVLDCAENIDVYDTSLWGDEFY